MKFLSKIKIKIKCPEIEFDENFSSIIMTPVCYVLKI